MEVNVSCDLSSRNSLVALHTVAYTLAAIFLISLMFAVVSIAGFQEKVSQGSKLQVPLLSAEPGKTVTFDTVLLLAKSDADVAVGTPTVPGASVEAKVLAHGKGDKIRVFKMRRRKGYRRVHGHRQEYSEIEVTKINAGK